MTQNRTLGEARNDEMSALFSTAGCNIALALRRAYLGRKLSLDRRQATLNFTTPPEFRQAVAF
jgi:hypothetical protein